jgi:RimJ/RimL family protein N-acetyltransferase
MSLELRTPSELFIRQAKEWHRDPVLNYWTGFGRGDAGIRLAHAALDQCLENCPDSIRLFALWDGPDAVGYVVFTDLDTQNKTGDLHITLAPQHQGKGYGPKALRRAVDMGFRDGLFRITFKPLASNRRAIETAVKAGFKVECRTKYAVWNEDGPQDQAQMRVVKPEWRKRTRKRVKAST